MENNTILVSTSSPINYPPMGSLYLIDALGKSGIKTTHLDSSVKFSDLEQKILETDSKVVNMSVITSPEIVNSVNLSKQIKEKYSEMVRVTKPGGEIMFQVLSEDMNKGYLWSYHEIYELANNLKKLGITKHDVKKNNLWTVFRCKV